MRKGVLLGKGEETGREFDVEATVLVKLVWVLLSGGGAGAVCVDNGWEDVKLCRTVETPFPLALHGKRYWATSVVRSGGNVAHGLCVGLLVAEPGGKGSQQGATSGSEQVGYLVDVGDEVGHSTMYVDMLNETQVAGGLRTVMTKTFIGRVKECVDLLFRRWRNGCDCKLRDASQRCWLSRSMRDGRRSARGRCSVRLFIALGVG